MRVEREQAAEEAVGRWGFRLTVAALIASAWVADLATQLLGYYVYLLTDPKVQSAWGSLMLLAAGGPFLLDAVAEWRRRRFGAASVTVTLATFLYGYSLYNTYLDPHRGDKPIHVYYWLMALVLVLADLAGLLKAAGGSNS